ncbi:PspC domain-containing protein [bacterium]|nr:MAG: PspC domain-containing protein [bacterium]
MEQNQEQIKRLYRSATDRVIFGVCGGLGKYLGVDSLIIRTIFIALVFGAGTGVVLYLILALLIPKEQLAAADGAFGEGQKTIDFRERVNDLASEFRGRKRLHKGRDIAGIIIVIFGIFLLVNNFFPIHHFFWSVFWPAALILLGILILRRPGGKE